MKWHETTYGVVLALVLVLAACNGGSDDVAAPTEVPVVETPTAVVEPDPTPTVEAVVVPEATDEDRLAAVVAAFDFAIEAGDAPESLIAYDLLDSEVNEDGVVTLNICGWTGDTVFDTVRDSIWRTAAEDDGSVTATHITTPVTSGDCINSHLIETALATVEEFDQYLKDVDAEPATFAADERTYDLLDDDFRDFLRPTFARWVDEGLYLGFSRRPGPALVDLSAELLWRRYEVSGEVVIEFVYCRPMEPDYGLYRDGVLVDDARGEGLPGVTAIDALQLQPDKATAAGWRATGYAAAIWSDCTAVQDWVQAASGITEAPVDLEVLDR